MSTENEKLLASIHMPPINKMYAIWLECELFRGRIDFHKPENCVDF